MPGRRYLLRCPVRPVGVVVAGVLTEDKPRVPLAGDEHPVRALARRALVTRRSAITFARGARAGDRWSGGRVAVFL